MANKLKSAMSDVELYRAVQGYLLDDKERWDCIPSLPSQEAQGRPDRKLFLGVRGAHIRFYLDYQSNPDKCSHHDLEIHFLGYGYADHVPAGYFYSPWGKENSLLGLVHNLDTDRDVVHRRGLWIDVGKLRELAESVYARVYAANYK